MDFQTLLAVVVGLLETLLREREEAGVVLLQREAEEAARAVEAEKRRQIAVVGLGNGGEELEVVF